MSHPHKHQAHKTGSAKLKSIGRHGNLPLHMMKGVGENMAGGIRESSVSMQHKKQAASSGMYKRGGAVHGHKHKAHMGKMAKGGLIPNKDNHVELAKTSFKGASRTISNKEPMAGHVTKGGGESGLGRLEKARTGFR